MSADECLRHPWLTNEDETDVLKTLETSWMKQVLARRRWHRWYHAVRAMQRIRKLSAAGKGRKRNGQTLASRVLPIFWPCRKNSEGRERAVNDVWEPRRHRQSRTHEPTKRKGAFSSCTE